MKVKRKKRNKRNGLSFGKVDSDYGRKLRSQESKEGKVARKRLKEFTTITGAKKKTRWYY